MLKAHLVGHKRRYVFCDNKGTRFANVRKAFVNALKEAGIEDFRFHHLRHTFASQLAMNGVGGTTLQALGRWKTPGMVMRYAHLSAQHTKTAIDKLCGVFEDNNGRTEPVRTVGVI